MTNLSGKTAIVTGAGRGIGRAIAVRLSSLGANVVINYAGNDEQAQITLGLCGEHAVLAKGDVSDFACCQKLFEVCEDTFGPPDILINNAGITKDGLLMRMSEADFDRVLDVNLKSAFHCSKLACRPMMKKRQGRIINISSVVAITGNAGQANYCASKAGLIGLTKSNARELASRGITVNAVAPGFIESDMTQALTDEQKKAMCAGIPLGYPGSAEDVAGVVAFLCGDDARYITGQVLSVDGGMQM